ncbi:hypothetical protein [Staphylococcus xylosus]|uniref:hypothetical protein n=1 Tax=Staphylococcus xylosus TaxID=1288 RepID=UPI001CDC964F|nr:hypothetical protein [Staphylococcus xylosus]UBV40081.1 hypothetical protein JGY87_12985 [Staphylococcus xylosus]
MSNNVLDISSLEIDHVLAGETEIYIVPIVAPVLRKGDSKGNAVDCFKQILGSSKIVQSFDVTIDHNDENEPFKIFEDREYCITDLTSLHNIKEVKRPDCNFGLRLYMPHKNKSKLKVINNDILKEINFTGFDISDLSKGLNFETLQPLKDAIIEQIQNKNGAKQKLFNEKQNKQVIAINKTEDSSDIQFLKSNLYNTLDSLIDKVYLDDENLEFRSIVDDKGYNEEILPTYRKLEQLTEDDFNKAKNDKLAVLEKKREDIINTIFNQLVNDLWSKSIEADKMRNYKSNDSQYHRTYTQIESKLQEDLGVIPKKVEEQTKKLEKEFETSKNERSEKARRDMEERIEREERPILTNRIREFEKTLSDKAKNAYNNQIKVLDANVKNDYDLHITKIVDDIVQHHQETIASKKSELQNIMEKDVETLVQKRSEDVDKLRGEISKLEQDLIHNEATFNERLDLAVNQKVTDYELKDSQMTDEINWLRVELEKSKRESADKDESIRSKEMELQNNRSHLDRLNQQLEQSNQTSLSISARAMEIKQQALSFSNIESNQSTFSKVAGPQNIDVGNLLDDDAEKAKRYERRKKPTFFTWLGGLFLCAVLGSGTLFGSHVANSQEKQDNNTETQTHVQNSQKTELSKNK